MTNDGGASCSTSGLCGIILNVGLSAFVWGCSTGTGAATGAATGTGTLCDLCREPSRALLGLEVEDADVEGEAEAEEEAERDNGVWIGMPMPSPPGRCLLLLPAKLEAVVVGGGVGKSGAPGVEDFDFEPPRPPPPALVLRLIGMGGVAGSRNGEGRLFADTAAAAAIVGGA